MFFSLFFTFASYIQFYLIPSSNTYMFKFHISKGKFAVLIFWTSEERYNARGTGIDKIKLPLDVAESSEIDILSTNGSSIIFSTVKQFHIR